MVAATEKKKRANGLAPLTLFLNLVQNPKAGQCRNAGKFGSGSTTSRSSG